MQVTLLEEPPFEAVYTTNEQPVKSKTAKETKVNNNTFIPVPDSGMTLSCVSVLSYSRVLSQIDCNMSFGSSFVGTACKLGKM